MANGKVSKTEGRDCAEEEDVGVDMVNTMKRE